ncbi:MAG: butyrate kinase [bacterium]|nr:butyrate kinase [bacterium]
MIHTILVINPGSTSTKLALWNDDGPICEENITHPVKDIAGRSVVDQLAFREQAILDFVARHGDIVPDAICGRGGPMRSLAGGTYTIDDAMLADLRSARYGEHASLLGGLIASKLGKRWDIPTFVVDPVSVDELVPQARLSGVPAITRNSRSHALSLKAVMRLAADELGRELASTSFVAAHMGGGITIAAVDGGKLTDVNDALLGMGPFSPFRAGALPLHGVLDLAFSPGAIRSDVEKLLATESGLYAYLGTGDLREIESRLDEPEVKSIFDAMVYQIAKEIGAMAAALGCKIDGVIMTGGMSHCRPLIDGLQAYIAPLGRLFLYPGEREMEALALGGLRVLQGKERAATYPANHEDGST